MPQATVVFQDNSTEIKVRVRRNSRDEILYFGRNDFHVADVLKVGDKIEVSRTANVPYPVFVRKVS